MDLRELTDRLLDARCEEWGIRNTILWLKDYGYSQEQIVSLGFDEDDVKEAFENDEF